ncbi:shikimate kinase [Alistipes sp.]|uniref:shikimate kinase n=1 Tax=Alistipes sp. TaxID=1872444 RepID=UPI0023F14EB1|nr:shikimate kinase [Alistipes sp.]
MKPFLVGYMGCGKSTLGRKLARRLGVGFVDTDALVEEQEGASVADVFRYEGEARFREAEREALERAIAAGGETVVSTGGAPHLERQHAAHERRGAYRLPAPHCGANRPPPEPLRTPETSPLAGLDDAGLVAFMERDMAVREPFYAQAHLVVDCDAMSDDQVVEHILRQLGLK